MKQRKMHTLHVQTKGLTRIKYISIAEQVHKTKLEEVLATGTQCLIGTNKRVSTPTRNSQVRNKSRKHGSEKRTKYISKAEQVQRKLSV